MSQTVIELKNVTKTYKLYEDDKQRFKALFIKNTPCKLKTAVNNVSFQIKQGETVALLGKNGTGKSTILKIITEVTYPDSGDVVINGRVSAILELDTGLEPKFTGRENIYLRGQILGLTEAEIKNIENEIIDFAELNEYIDQPVRTYSSGMKARLGFAINVNVEPDILIIDEILSVGDQEYMGKCQRKIKELVEKKHITLVYVTHETAVAKEFCKRGLVIKEGNLIFDGVIEKAIQEYKENLR